MATRAVTSAGFARPGEGLPPLEEFDSVEAWLLALPGRTAMRIGLQDGSSYLTSVAQLLESQTLDAVVERFRIQLRLAGFQR